VKVSFRTRSMFDFPFDPSVSVVVCHGIYFDSAQYPLVPRPDLRSSYVAITIAGIICQHYNVLCVSGPFGVHYAEVYLDSIDFVSKVRWSDFSVPSLY
jgi:hypothetical protein